MPVKKHKVDLDVKEESMTPVMVGLLVLGNPISKIADMLGIHRQTVSKYLESREAKTLIEPFKQLIVMMHGRATEVLLEDLSYEGENVALLQLRQKAALRVLQSTGIIPKEGGGDQYLMQQNNFYGNDEAFRKLAMSFLGIGGPEVSAKAEAEVPAGTEDGLPPL